MFVCVSYGHILYELAAAEPSRFTDVIKYLRAFCGTVWCGVVRRSATDGFASTGDVMILRSITPLDLLFTQRLAECTELQSFYFNSSVLK